MEQKSSSTAYPGKIQGGHVLHKRMCVKRKIFMQLLFIHFSSSHVLSGTRAAISSDSYFIHKATPFEFTYIMLGSGQ